MFWRAAWNPSLTDIAPVCQDYFMVTLLVVESIWIETLENLICVSQRGPRLRAEGGGHGRGGTCGAAPAPAPPPHAQPQEPQRGRGNCHAPCLYSSFLFGLYLLLLFYMVCACNKTMKVFIYLPITCCLLTFSANSWRVITVESRPYYLCTMLQKKNITPAVANSASYLSLSLCRETPRRARRESRVSPAGRRGAATATSLPARRARRAKKARSPTRSHAVPSVRAPSSTSPSR